MTPRFYAEATVVIDRQQVSERIVEPTIDADALDRIGAMAAQVLSRARLAALIEEHDLYAEARRTRPLEEIVAWVRSDVTIEQAQDLAGGRAGRQSAQVYAVGFEADRAATAAAVANALADHFVQVSIENQHRQHHLATEFLRRELAAAEQELREQNRQIADFKREYRGMLPDEERTNLARLALLQQQRQSLALQIAETEARVVTLSSAEDNSPGARLLALRAELVQQRSLRTDRHPDVISLKAQIEALEAELGEDGADPASPGSLMQASEGQLSLLRAQLAQTEDELEALDARIEQMPAVQEQLAALVEKETILREQYFEFLRKVKDSELSESLLVAQQSDRVSVLNPAVPPTQPTKARWKFLALGLVASLGLSAGLGLALEALDPVLVTPAQVEAAGGIPVLASVPRIT
jgi:uncharacterized protein involved in exopolysaccharide biosynthesis